MRLRRFVGVLAALALSLASACDGRAAADSRVVRIGHFPNMTHAHALVARALAREGKGWFEERLGEGVRVEWFTYNAGPSAMEALLAGSLDATYVGPSPAINAHVRTGGAEVRVIAAAARGGSALVVRGDGTLREPQDFRGKRIATPQLGNTQDVACRAWLADHGLRTSLTGGDAFVVPTENPDQIPLFQRGDLDAAWTVEPWVSRLELEAKGRVLVEDRDALTTVLAASARFLGERPALARALAAAHAELTLWIAGHPEEAKRLARAELAAETTRAPSVELLDRAWSRMRFDVAVAPAEFESFLAAARKVGFLRDARGLARLVEVPQ